MTEPTADPNAEVIADLARRAYAAAHPEAYELEGDTETLVVRVVRHDETVKVLDLEPKLGAPRRPTGSATLFDPADFADYVNRLSDEKTTVWGHEERASFVAVFNDHVGHEAGWRDHSATLQLQPDPEWQSWMQFDGKWFGQTDFAEFLEDHAAAIIDPAPADFLEVATTFKAHKKAEFASKVDLTTTDLQLTYNEETTAKTTRAGQIEVPRRFVVSLAPFLGTIPRELSARLRWSIEGGQLSIGFKLHRPDLVKRDAFADIRTMIGDQLSGEPYPVPVLLGSRPQLGTTGVATAAQV